MLKCTKNEKKNYKNIYDRKIMVRNTKDKTPKCRKKIYL